MERREKMFAFWSKQLQKFSIDRFSELHDYTYFMGETKAERGNSHTRKTVKQRTELFEQSGKQKLPEKHTLTLWHSQKFALFGVIRRALFRSISPCFRCVYFLLGHPIVS